MKKGFYAALLLTVSTLTFTSCDKDFTEVGSEIFGEDEFGFDKYEVANVESKMVKTGVFNSRNLPYNTFGVFQNGVFGKTTAHFVTQIEMIKGTELSEIGNNPVLDSVYVYIPYTSTVAETDSDGNATYNLTNVYGTGKFSLNVYENGYFLRDVNPGEGLEAQQYFSDQKNTFDSNKKGLNGTNIINNSTNTAQNSDFVIDKSEIRLYKYNSQGEIIKDAKGNPVIKERKKPGMWLDLDKTYFQNRFFANNTYKGILNNNVLKEFFRGLYFNVEDLYNQSALAQLAVSEGTLVFIYKQDKTNNDGETTRERKTLTFNLGHSASSGNTRNATTVNLFETVNSQTYQNQLTNNNDQKLWIRGTEGSIAEINLFGEDANNNNIADELEYIKSKNWLINQAVLTVYVDNATMANAAGTDPYRLFLYDLTNNKALIDYTADTSTNPAKKVYNGILDKNTTDNVTKYRFRITSHINNLIRKDSTNVKLGLAVVDDITQGNFTLLKDKNTFPKKIPTLSAAFPFGSVLYGANHPDTAKRIKLEIYYTKENN